MKAFDIFVKGVFFDTVVFQCNVSIGQAKKSLIENDGYDSKIKVVEVQGFGVDRKSQHIRHNWAV